MERIFNGKRCPQENKLTYIKYLFTGKASPQWSSMRLLLEGSGTLITQELFKKKFYVKYFLDSAQFAKEVEFLLLVQLGMFVSEYADQFKHLICFHTLSMDKKQQCRKFENWLTSDIKLLVVGLCIKEFPALVESARVLEKTKQKVESQQRQLLKAGGPFGCRSNFGDMRKPYSWPSFYGSRGSSSQHLLPQGSQLDAVRCYQCGGLHVKTIWPQLTSYNRCNQCSKKGHYEKDCPSHKRRVSLSREEVSDLRLRAEYMPCHG